VADGAGAHLGRRIAFVALVLGLVALTAGFAVSAGFESSRAGRAELATRHTNDKTRQSRAQTAALDRQVRSDQALEQRLEADADVLSTIDLAPMTSYTAVNNAIGALTNAVDDLVGPGGAGDARARLLPLVSVARAKVADFERDVIGYDAARKRIGTDVAAAHR